MNPKYPVYVITKGRWRRRLTIRTLERMKVPHYVVVEPQEKWSYEIYVDASRLLVLPFSNLGQGSIPARNFCWEDAISKGFARHWIIDDNIDGFFRLHENKKYLLGDGTGFRIIEEFCDRYSNVAISGMSYQWLAKRRQKLPPIYFNRRVYSCILIDNSIPFRWRGRYNEDTDLCLRVLKSGLCTILFLQFLCGKAATMTMKGGNTDKLYKGDGRLAMAQSLAEQHPDVAGITQKWGRWQHSVNYAPFQHNELKRRPEVHVPPGENNFGLRLISLDIP